MDIQRSFGFLKIQFDHFSKGNEEKGQALKKAGHVYEVRERSGLITSKVMRQTSVNLPPYTVEITLDKERNVRRATCSCIAGISGHCKHLSATVFCVNDEKSTRTSVPCTWKEPYIAKIAKANYLKGQRFSDIFGVSKRTNVFSPVEVTAEMVTFSPPSMLQYMLGASTGVKPSTSRTSSRNVTSREFEAALQVSEISNGIEDIIDRQRNSKILNFLYQLNIELTYNCCKETYNNCIPCNAVEVCSSTLKNKDSWMMQRKFRITASRAYPLFTYKGNDWNSKSLKYFSNIPFCNKYTQHGIDWEPVARSLYSREKNCFIQEVGLVVCQSDPWLAVSPDGVIFENGEPVKLLEIKCPFIGQTISANNIEHHWQYLKREKGQLILKGTNKHYAQVQLNMAVLNLKECDFVVFCSGDKTFKTVRVPFNEEFTKKLLSKLKKIYFGNMLHTLCGMEF